MNDVDKLHYHETYVRTDAGWRIQTTKLTRLRVEAQKVYQGRILWSGITERNKSVSRGDLLRRLA